MNTSATTIYSVCVGLTLGYACNTPTETKKEETTESKPAKPNVIIFLADDLGYNDVSVYRNQFGEKVGQYPTCQTPAIDKLAEQGMRFSDFYCGAAVSSPSRAVLLTGRNASRVGIYNWIPHKSPMHLRAEEVTIAEILKDAGYKTAHFGKWHLTSKGMDQPLPNDQGFDYSFFAYNNARPSHKNPVNYFRNGEAVGELQGYACHLVVDEAIDWLKKKKQDNVPYYINIWFNEPHEKVAAPDSLTKKHEYNEKYYGAIENMDNAMQRLLDFIKSNNLDNNTIIIFSSDNGSQVLHSNDPLRGEKCFNYDGGIRIPFIIKWQDSIQAGTVSQVPGSFADILPTLAEFTGASLPENRKLDGTSLVPVLLSKKDSIIREEPIFFYRYFHEPICMMRRGDWTLLGYQDTIAYAQDLDQKELAKFKPSPEKQLWSQWNFQENHMKAIPEQKPVHFELYNNSVDKAQMQNVAGKYPEKVEEMKTEMLQVLEEMKKEGGDWFDE